MNVLCDFACGQGGEIGLGRRLPWEGQYHEDRYFYERQTKLAMRIGTRGAIAHFSPSRPCCLISSEAHKPANCSFVYNWKEFSVEEIFSDIEENSIFKRKSLLVVLIGIMQLLLTEFTSPVSTNTSGVIDGLICLLFWLAANSPHAVPQKALRN